MNIEQAIEAGNAWVAHAKPIIRAYLAMEEVDIVNAICSVHNRKDAYGKVMTGDYREANGYIKDAQQSLYDMLDGIRDNYICDHSRSFLVEMTEAAGDAVDAWNDELARLVVSVEGAVRVVEGER